MKKTTVKDSFDSLKVGDKIYVEATIKGLEPSENWDYVHPVEIYIQRVKYPIILLSLGLNDTILIPYTEPQTLPNFEPKIGVQCVCITETGERKVVTPTLYKGEVIYVDRFFVVVENPASFQRLY
jgi:hypothetical protein